MPATSKAEKLSLTGDLSVGDGGLGLGEAACEELDDGGAGGASKGVSDRLARISASRSYAPRGV